MTITVHPSIFEPLTHERTTAACHRLAPPSLLKQVAAAPRAVEALVGATAMRGSRLLAGAVLCRLVQAQLLSPTQLAELLHHRPLDAITTVLATPGWEAAGAATLPKPSAVRALTPFPLIPTVFHR